MQSLYDSTKTTEIKGLLNITFLFFEGVWLIVFFIDDLLIVLFSFFNLSNCINFGSLLKKLHDILWLSWLFVVSSSLIKSGENIWFLYICVISSSFFYIACSDELSSIILFFLLFINYFI